MSKQIEFNQHGLERHECQTWQEGDWIVLHCPKCNFQRMLNWKNGKIKVLNNNDNVLHFGSNMPVDAQEPVSFN